MQGRRASLQYPADLAEPDLAGKAGEMVALRRQAVEGGVRRARQDKEQTGREREDADRHKQAQTRQPDVKSPETAARHQHGPARRTADFRAGERGHEKKQKRGQEEQETHVRRKHGRPEQLQKSNHADVRIVPAGLRRQRPGHGPEENQMHSQQAGQRVQAPRTDQRQVTAGDQAGEGEPEETARQDRGSCAGARHLFSF